MPGDNKRILPQRRSLLVLVTLLLLLASFFSIYYFYYIPGNKQQLHQYGFRILSRIKTNMISRNQDLLKRYKNYLSYYSSNNTVLPEGVRPVSLDTTGMDIKPGDTIRLAAIENDHFIYMATTAGKAVRLPVAGFLRPIVNYRHELFETYFLINLPANNKGGTIIYGNGNIGVDHNIQVDSFLKLNKGALFSQILDIDMAGLRYKMFTYPFSMDGHRFILCGLVKMSTYSQQLNRLPVSFIYWVVITLLLLIISLPFIRIYLIGANEQVGIIDLLTLTGALFVGITLITVIIIQVLLLKGGYKRAEDALTKLSTHMEQSIHEELGLITSQLKNMDTALQHTPHNICVDKWESLPLRKRNDPGDSTLCFNYRDTAGYYNFERVIWIDKAGWQQYKAQPKIQKGFSDTFFINVKGRNYFNYFKDTIKRQDQPDSVFLDPIYSWYTGDFKVNVAMRSKADSAFIIVMVTRMYSLLNAVLPAGYGFSLIGADGKVYAHSDRNRNLKENFFEETDAPAALRQAIISRENKYIQQALCYGSQHALYIHPLEQLPFYLVTFYDNKYIVPVNMRILIFALLFSLVTCGAVGVVFFFMRIQTLYYSYVQPVVTCFRWMIPRRELSFFYRLSSGFMAVYLVVFFFVVLRIFADYTVFALALLTPLNLMVFMHLYCLCYCNLSQPPVRALRTLETRRLFKLPVGYCGMEEGRTAALLITGIIFWGYTVFISWLLQVGEAERSLQYWVFQTAFFLLVTVFLSIGVLPLQEVTRHREKEKDPASKGAELPGPAPAVQTSFLHHYCLFVIVLVLSFSAAPVAVYTWFAHHHEIRQSVRKQQLFIVNALAQRRGEVADVLLKHPFSNLPRHYYRTLQYRKGLFGINNDRVCTGINPGTHCERWNKGDSARYFSEMFYLGMADRTSNQYYDPFNYPALHRTTADTSWCWHLQGDSVVCLNYRFRPDPYLKMTDTAANGIQVRSTLPRSYYYLGINRDTAMLTLIVVLILTILFFVIKKMASCLFLLRMQFVCNGKSCRPRYWPGTGPAACYPTVYDEEREVLNSLKKDAVQYKDRWDACSDKEKLLLLDIAGDGLMNYRNSTSIANLLDHGILCAENGWIRISEPAFGIYVRGIRHSEMETALRKNYPKVSLWQMLHTPVMVIILAVAVFIFFTQEDMSRKVVAVVSALSTLLPLLPKLFGGVRAAGEAK